MRRSVHFSLKANHTPTSVSKSGDENDTWRPSMMLQIPGIKSCCSREVLLLTNCYVTLRDLLSCSDLDVPCSEVCLSVTAAIINHFTSNNTSSGSFFFFFLSLTACEQSPPQPGIMTSRPLQGHML